MKPTQDRIKELFLYNSETGDFIHRQGRLKGEPAGSAKETEQGRIIIYVDGKLYKAHHLIWLYVTGEWPSQIDHRDGNASNNRWTNLRETDNSLNMANRNHKLNKHGLRGVDLHGRKWRAKIKVRGKQIYLGFFQTQEEAVAAYEAARREYFGDFDSRLR